MSTTHFSLGHKTARILAFFLLLLALLALPINGIASTSESTLSSPNLDATTDTAHDPTVVDRTLEGRHRLEFRAGYWDSGRVQSAPHVVSTADMTRVEDVLGTFSYAYWVHDQLATDVTLRGLVAEATSIESIMGTSESAVVITSAMFGIRLYPISSALTPLRPYVTTAIGPYIGIESHKETVGLTTEHVKTLGIFGGYFGGGLDVQIGRHLMAGVHVGYNLMADFPETLGLERNYSGLEVSAGFSVLLGK